MAQRSAEATRLPSMELTSDGPTLAWSPDGIGLPAERTPGVVFKRLFEVPPGGSEKQRRSPDRKRSILDLVLEDARRLERGLGNADRGRLDQYLTSVREVEIRNERSTKWLDTPLPKVEPAARARVDREVSQQMVGEYFRTMYDLVVLAFRQTLAFRSGTEGVVGKRVAVLFDLNLRDRTRSMSSSSPIFWIASAKCRMPKDPCSTRRWRSGAAG